MALSDIPQKDADGKWRVGQEVFATNAQAWRYIDRVNREPVSRAEDVADWIASKIANST